jgi:hypothetical protein
MNLLNIYKYENYNIYNNTYKEKKNKWYFAHKLFISNEYTLNWYRINAELYLPIEIKIYIYNKILNKIKLKKNIININNKYELSYHINLELDILYNNLKIEEKILIIFYKLLGE